MEKLTYQYIESCVLDLAKIIDAPENVLPKYGLAEEAQPYVLISYDDKLFFEAQERGTNLWSIYAANLDDLLYAIFNDITEQMAYQESRNQKNENEDNRRVKLRRKLQLLGLINKEWQHREQKIQDLTIRESMFNDYAGKKQALYENLLSDGLLKEEALIKLKETFPD